MKIERFCFGSGAYLKVSWGLEILEDERVVASLREAEEDVRAGRVRDCRRLVEELRRSGEV